jgi:glucans biosynthesis protein
LSDFNPSRRDLLTSALASGALYLLPAIARAAEGPDVKFGPEEPFSFDTLRSMAEQLAQSPFQPTPIEKFELLDSIDYDRHNQIRYKPENILWKDRAEGPAIGFFFPGRYFKEPIRVHALEGGMSREILFSSNLFEIPEDNPARQLGDQGGFAGFRVMGDATKPDWMAFLGGAYFRTAGYSGQFGLSARGLAIDSGAPTPEEFPRFTSFWFEAQEGGGITIYALLDSPRVSGAYRIASTRDNGIFQDIDCSLFLRGDIERLGIAPMTSMFWIGKHNRHSANDWRPEIHDNDGLEIHTGSGERIWRPLNNPPQAMTNTFATENPIGFGLMQRERRFSQYQDDGVFYDKRASLWAQPKGDWGKGEVMLVELSTNDEIHDNIGVFWRPAEPAVAGNRYDLGYRLNWVENNPEPEGAARFIATRLGAGGIPGQPRPANVVKIVCDFENRGLEELGRESGVTLEIGASSGAISNEQVFPVVSTDYWRASFDLEIGPDRARDKPIDIRMYVVHEGTAMTETFLMQLFPSQVHDLLDSRA